MSYREQLDQLSDSDLMAINEIYIDNCNYPNDRVFNNDEDFFETYFAEDIMGAVGAVSYGDYDLSHDYVIVNEYGNLESSNSISDLIDLDSIANDIEENYDSYSRYIDEIEEAEEEEEEA